MSESAPSQIEVQGVVYAVQHYPQRRAYPAERLLVGTEIELLDERWADDIAGSWDDMVIALVEPGGIVVAAIAYSHQAWRRQVWLTLGVTDVNWRRGGLYKALWAQFVDHVRQKYPQAVSICSGYHVDNRASAAMHRSLGRRVTHHMTAFDLVPQGGAQ